ncbi:hypothetical protein ACHAWX_007199 [Stephanocyclus meneghinianus]
MKPSSFAEVKPNDQPTPYPTWGGGGWNNYWRPQEEHWRSGSKPGKSGKGQRPLGRPWWMGESSKSSKMFSHVKPKSTKPKCNGWNDGWAEEGVWLGTGSSSLGWGMMSMDYVVATTPPPNYGMDIGWDGSSAKPKSEKNSNGWVNSGWAEDGSWVASKNSKTYPEWGIVSKSTKSSSFGSDSPQHFLSMEFMAATTSPPNNSFELSAIKLAHKTGKVSSLSDWHVIAVSKSAKLPLFNMTMHNSIPEEMGSNGVIGIKLASKTGKSSFPSTNTVVSKSAKSLHYSHLSVDYSYEGMTSEGGAQTMLSISKATKNPNDIVSKSMKSASETSNLKDNYSDFVMSNGIKVTSKTGKGPNHFSMDFIQDTFSSKTPKDVFIGSKSNKSPSSGVIFNEEPWIAPKSAKSLVSKSLKSAIDLPINVNIIVTPEEAGLPFRAKSSKSVPLQHVYSTPANNSIPVKVSRLNKLDKQVQLIQQPFAEERSAEMPLRDYYAVKRPPQKDPYKSGAKKKLRQWPCVLASIVAVVLFSYF